MYSHCYHCIADLGTNGHLTTFPTGRRLVFDEKRGRLWVVCTRCGNWNLAPLENRWEPLRECQEAFSSAKRTVGSGNIAIAEVSDSLHLIRIGDVDGTEYAVWRYGERFHGRRTAAIMGNSLRFTLYGLAGWGAWLVNSPLAYLMAGSFCLMTEGIRQEMVKDSVTKELARALGTHPDPEVRRVVLTGGGYIGATLRSCSTTRRSSDVSLTLKFRWPGRRDAAGRLVSSACTLEGGDASRALGVMLPILNRGGSNRANITAALQELSSVNCPEDYFGVAEARARMRGRGYGSLSALPVPIRLALEMAAHADEERSLLERGELALLKGMWRRAEEIAAIADRLASADVEEHLQRMQMLDIDAVSSPATADR